MPELSVLIAEDEKYIREYLKNIIIEMPGIKQIYESDNGVEALKIYEKKIPNIVLIDINLPEKNGLELAQEIFDINPFCYIIFCTGLVDYREKAFEVYAYDYITKPFNTQRLVKTLNRILQIEKYIKRNNVNKNNSQKIKLIKSENRYVRLNVKEIIFITRESRKTVIIYSAGKAEINETLEQLEEELKDYNFFRSHKGFLINVNMVNEVIHLDKNTYCVNMKFTNDKPLMTWEKFREFEKIFK